MKSSIKTTYNVSFELTLEEASLLHDALVASRVRINDSAEDAKGEGNIADYERLNDYWTIIGKFSQPFLHILCENRSND